MNSNSITPWFQDRYLDFHARIIAKTLHHGLLLSGGMGIGKAEFASGIAKSLLCLQPTNHGPCGQCQSCLLDAAGSHPDIYLVQSEKQIGVDAIREVSNKLNQTAQISLNKVCIILEADSMTEAAANALLKTLEEPTPNTYLILVSNAHHKLLPTILSRCEKHALASPTTEQTKAWIKQALPAAEIPDGLLSMFAQSPLVLKQRLESDSLPDMNALNNDLNNVKSGKNTAISIAKKWEAEPAILVSWCQQLAHEHFKQTLLSEDYSRYQSCLDTRSKLEQQGINVSLSLQHIIRLAAEII
jgi:DNA polymerase-3 subunit delta'